MDNAAARACGTDRELVSAVQDARAIDRYVGRRIRERRIMLGISQHDLAHRLGVSCQQAHRYESGQTRVSAGTLHHLARLFHVDIDYFFHGLQDQAIGRGRDWQRLFIELARAFERLQDDDQRRFVLDLSRFFTQTSAGSKLSPARATTSSARQRTRPALAVKARASV